MAKKEDGRSDSKIEKIEGSKPIPPIKSIEPTEPWGRGKKNK